MIRADISFAYHIHKMWREFMEDTKQVVDPKHTNDLAIWIPHFGKEHFFCHVLMHGKKHVGMIWGETGKSSAEFYGIFIRRGWRSNRRAIVAMVRGMAEFLAKNDIIAISAVVPENLRSWARRKGLKVRALVVEKSVGENKWLHHFKKVYQAREQGHLPGHLQAHMAP